MSSNAPGTFAAAAWKIRCEATSPSTLRRVLCAAALVSALVPALHAQAPGKAFPPVAESVLVLGEPEPTRLGESSRSGLSTDLAPLRLHLAEITDELRTDSSVDLQQRGTGNTQSDLSLRGSSFEQTLVLLNGFRINDVETAHFNFDLPVPLEAVAGLDVLHGAGSTLYGSDALGGVVNVRTAVPAFSSLRLRTGVGSFGINTQSIVASLARPRFSQVLAGSRDFSSGFLPDRDYRTEQLSDESVFSSPLGSTRILLAGSDHAFGADQFYGNYPSFERTKGWYAFLTQQLGPATQAALGYRRHTDRFVLVRANPGLYTNQHIDESWQAVLRRSDRLGTHATLQFGLEEDLDAIQSTNLGRHGRNRGSGYAQFRLAGARGVLLGGLRQELLSGGTSVTSPSLSGSLPLARALKLRGALGYGFRIPTFTDLYYSDPATLGNAALRPESAWSYEGGVDWFPSPRLLVSATGFTSRQQNTIDYTRASSTARYQATNLAAFAYTGAEAALDWRAPQGSLRVSWTFLAGARQLPGNQQSRYLFQFPVHNASIEWLAQPTRQLTARTTLQVVQRLARDPYALVNLSLARSQGRIQPYLQLSNLANTGYQEIQGVRVQGRAVLGGLLFQLSRQQ